jgi:hypothetical protein
MDGHSHCPADINVYSSQAHGHLFADQTDRADNYQHDGCSSSHLNIHCRGLDANLHCGDCADRNADHRCPYGHERSSHAHIDPHADGYGNP